MLFPNDESKRTIKKYEELWNGAKSQVYLSMGTIIQKCKKVKTDWYFWLGKIFSR